MKHRLISILMISAIAISSCGSKITGDDVIKSFKDAGLEAENPTQMTKDDYKVAPYVCTGTHFYIPSLGEGAGGRVFICNDSKEMDLLSNYYIELGRSSAVFFSWVFIKGDVLVQINGDLPEAKARQYESAIP